MRVRVCSRPHIAPVRKTLRRARQPRVGQQAVVLALDHGVAFAHQGFEPRPVEDPDAAGTMRIVDFALGKGSGGQWFNGLIDEARVHSVALTPEWIAAEHANLTSPTFVTVGGGDPLSR